MTWRAVNHDDFVHHLTSHLSPQDKHTSQGDRAKHLLQATVIHAGKAQDPSKAKQHLLETTTLVLGERFSFLLKMTELGLFRAKATGGHYLETVISRAKNWGGDQNPDNML